MFSVRFMFLRDRQGQPVGCIAMSVDEVHHVISYGLSVLNPKDDFNRALARKIAEGRLNISPRGVVIPSGVDLNMHVISSLVMEDVSLPGTPMRARKAALRWLEANTFHPIVH